MRYYADLHVHSKYSRACSRDCDLEHLAWWARRKGVTVVGTGDVTHPAWTEELTTKLVPAEPGLFRLRDDLDREVLRTLPPSCHGDVRFQLQVEISTIYKRDDRTRKVHHLCHLPDFAAMAEFTRRLARIGNLGSDGRPILGLDSRDLLEITLESGDGAYLVPAHVWTPWFAVLGSKSGFDAVEDCYADLADHVFALETGLSSDPSMNWRVGKLDRYRLVSNSDAHSPPMLARNATVFDTDLGFAELRDALRTGDGYVGTVDMFPEEGKYHHDGHRKCGVHLEPPETKSRGGLCPECGKPLTVGVLHRIDDLADHGPGRKPATAGEFHSIVALPEIMGEILGVGPKSKAVGAAVDELVATLGPELAILLELPPDRLRKARSPLLAEAVDRLRAGRVRREAGYDGEYGTISLFEPGEVRGAARSSLGLFDLPEEPRARKPRPTRERPEPVASLAVPPLSPAAVPPVPDPADRSLLDGLDPDQRAAAELVEGPLLIVAGPGTGKTRTLTHRLAHVVLGHGVPARNCLAITFTRRAADEMRERLAALLPGRAGEATVVTFHRLGLDLVRERHERLGLPADVAVADETRRLGLLRDLLAERDGRVPGPTEVRRLVAAVSEVKRSAAARLAGGEAAARPDADLLALAARYDAELRDQALVDFDDLLTLPVRLLVEHADLVEHYRDRFRWVCVDEYQDVDELQYRLLRLLCPPGGNLCAIGDPDQAIYSFRGADVGFFLRFRQDFPGARLVSLTRNYRSSPVIVSGALAAIAPGSLVPDRELRAMRERDGDGTHIVVRAAGDEESEARFVVDTIQELLGGASFHARDAGVVDGDGVSGGLSFDDIAILYRTGSQARPVMAALAKEGLPYQQRSHDRLGDHDGVRALLPRVAGGDASRGTVALVREAAAAEIDAAGDDRDRVDVVRTAADLLGPLAARHAGAPAAFLAELALGTEVDEWDPRADRISLLTLHAAKGLEFPVVFIVGCADGLLPLRWPGSSNGPRPAGGDGAAMGGVATGDGAGSGRVVGTVLSVAGTVDPVDPVAEERRLFFVGVSRAQAHLYLSHPLRDRGPGRERELRPSPFLAAFDESLVRRVAAPVPRRPKASQLRLL